MATVKISITLEDGELLDQFDVYDDRVNAIELSHIVKDVLSFKLNIKDDLSDDEPVDTDGDPAKGHRC